MKLNIFLFSSISAAMQALLLIPAFILTTFFALTQNYDLFIPVVAVLIIGTFFAIIVSIGYVKLSIKQNNSFLKTVALIGIGLTIISLILQMFDLIAQQLLITIIVLILSICTGAIMIAYGLALRKVKQKIAKKISLMYFIMGGFYFTIIFVFLIPILSTITSVMESILFYNESRRSR